MVRLDEGTLVVDMVWGLPQEIFRKKKLIQVVHFKTILAACVFLFILNFIF